MIRPKQRKEGEKKSPKKRKKSARKRLQTGEPRMPRCRSYLDQLSALLIDAELSERLHDFNDNKATGCAC